LLSLVVNAETLISCHIRCTCFSIHNYRFIASETWWTFCMLHTSWSRWFLPESLVHNPPLVFRSSHSLSSS